MPPLSRGLRGQPASPTAAHTDDARVEAVIQARASDGALMEIVALGVLTILLAVALEGVLLEAFED